MAKQITNPSAGGTPASTLLGAAAKSTFRWSPIGDVTEFLSLGSRSMDEFYPELRVNLGVLSETVDCAGSPQSRTPSGRIGFPPNSCAKQDKVRVYVRMRPFSESEKVCPLKQVLCLIGETIVLRDLDQKLTGMSREPPHKAEVAEFKVDYIQDDSYLQVHSDIHKEESQKRMYGALGVPCVESALDGYNTTILAYGQTGSGKTYTMMGDNTRAGRGLIPRLASDLMMKINEESNNGVTYTVQVSYLEIYQEKIRDLLAEEEVEEETRPPAVPNLAFTSAGLNSDDKVRFPVNNVDAKSYTNSFLNKAALLRQLEASQKLAKSMSEDGKSPRERPLTSSSHDGGLNKSKRAKMKPVFQTIFNGQNIHKHFRTFSTVLDEPAPIKKQNFLKIREHPITGPFVEGLVWKDVYSWCDMETLMKQGSESRTTGSTDMNEQSSRSHAVFSIRLTRKAGPDLFGVQPSSVSYINLVDLAGSEKLPKLCSGAVTGQRTQDESRCINRSLSQLNEVILSLSKSSFVSYRNSVLTWLLKESLGGSSRTFMVANISPTEKDLRESINTLRYATTANRIPPPAAPDQDPRNNLIKKLKEEIRTLRSLLLSFTSVNENAPSDRLPSMHGFKVPCLDVGLQVDHNRFPEESTLGKRLHDNSNKGNQSGNQLRDSSMQQSILASGRLEADSQMELKDHGAPDMVNEIAPEDCKRIKRAHRTLFLKISGRDFGNQASTMDFGVMEVGNQVTLRDFGAVNVFQQTSLMDPGAKDAYIQTTHCSGAIDAGQQTDFKVFGIVVDAENQFTLRRWVGVNIGQQTNLKYLRAVDVGSQTASTEARGVNAEQQTALAILGTMKEVGHQIALRNWGNVDVSQQTVPTGYASGEQIPLLQSVLLDSGPSMISKGNALNDKARSQANSECLDAGKDSRKRLVSSRSSGAGVNVDQQPHSINHHTNAGEESPDSWYSNAELLDHQRALLDPTLTSSASYLTPSEGSAPVGAGHQPTLRASVAERSYSQTDSKHAIAETSGRTDWGQSRATNSDQQKDLEVNHAISRRTTTCGTVEVNGDRQFHVNGWDDANIDFGCQVACGQCGSVILANQQSASPCRSPKDNCSRNRLGIGKARKAWPLFQCGTCGAGPGSSTVVIPTAVVQLLQDATSDVGLQTSWIEFCANDRELQTARTDIGVSQDVNQMTPSTVCLHPADRDDGSQGEGILSPQGRQHVCRRHFSACVRPHGAGSKQCQLVGEDFEEGPPFNFATAFHEGAQELCRWEERFWIPNSAGCQVCKREYMTQQWLGHQGEEGKAPNDLHTRAHEKDLALSHFETRSIPGPLPRIKHLCRGKLREQALPRDLGFVDAEQQTRSSTTRLKEANAQQFPQAGKPTLSVGFAKVPYVNGEACEGINIELSSQETYEDESMEERRHSSHNAGMAEQNFHIQKQASNSKELVVDADKTGLLKIQPLEGDLVGLAGCTRRKADSTTVGLEEEAFHLCSLWTLDKLRSRIESYAPEPQPTQSRPRSILSPDCRGLGLTSSSLQFTYCSTSTAESGVQKDDSLCPGESRKVDNTNLSDVFLHICSLWVFVILKVCAEESKLRKGLGKLQVGHAGKRPRLPLLAVQDNSKLKALRRPSNFTVVSASSAAAVDESTRRFVLKREHRAPKFRHLRYFGVEPVTFKSSTPFFIQSSGECSLVRRRLDPQLPAPGPAGGIQGLNCYKITCGVQSRRVVHFLKNGVNRLGSNSGAHIRIKGLSEDHTEIIYMPPHCCIQKKGYVVARLVAPGAMAFLNGQPMLEHKELSTGDVLVLRDLRHRSSVCTLHFFDLVKFASLTA